MSFTHTSSPIVQPASRVLHCLIGLLAVADFPSAGPERTRDQTDIGLAENIEKCSNLLIYQKLMIKCIKVSKHIMLPTITTIMGAGELDTLCRAGYADNYTFEGMYRSHKRPACSKPCAQVLELKKQVTLAALVEVDTASDVGVAAEEVDGEKPLDRYWRQPVSNDVGCGSMIVEVKGRHSYSQFIFMGGLDKESFSHNDQLESMVVACHCVSLFSVKSKLCIEQWGTKRISLKITAGKETLPLLASTSCNPWLVTKVEWILTTNGFSPSTSSVVTPTSLEVSTSTSAANVTCFFSSSTYISNSCGKQFSHIDSLLRHVKTRKGEMHLSSVPSLLQAKSLVTSVHALKSVVVCITCPAQCVKFTYTHDGGNSCDYLRLRELQHVLACTYGHLLAHPGFVLKVRDVIARPIGRRKAYANGIQKSLSDGRECIDILENATRILNCDETGMQLRPKSGTVVGLKDLKNSYEVTVGQEKELITVLCTFTMNGDAVSLMIIYPYKRLPVSICKSVPKDWGVGRSDLSWMVLATFYEYVANITYLWLVKDNAKFPVTLFLGRHKSHLSLEFSKFCDQKEILLYCLPPNAAHIMQPYDVCIFSPLKVNWRKFVQHEKQKAFDTTVHPQLVQNAFRVCGFFPFNEDAVDFSKCLSHRCQEMKNGCSSVSPTLAEYATAKEAIESLIGPTETANMNRAIEEGTSMNTTKTLFDIWKMCREKCTVDISLSAADTCTPTEAIQGIRNMKSRNSETEHRHAETKEHANTNIVDASESQETSFANLKENGECGIMTADENHKITKVEDSSQEEKGLSDARPENEKLRNTEATPMEEKLSSQSQAMEKNVHENSVVSKFHREQEMLADSFGDDIPGCCLLVKISYHAKEISEFMYDWVVEKLLGNDEASVMDLK
ncbi:hypothetical protein PR048_014906 [Dryococelus australis]|uniref:C2H2-type domain-containing protein n=1 Tax=Dryococelus australis TaxID=614101 RepID=A0ABQ9HFG5_9NEOP|nr:hypothetical protein PR048_014906 [Dryococelus australis]